MAIEKCGRENIAIVSVVAYNEKQNGCLDKKKLETQ